MEVAIVLFGGPASICCKTGRAVVFDNVEDLHSRINDENLDIDENCIMVLRNCGPRGYPGMAELGNMPSPAKLPQGYY
jgi:dihydroxy-acid dehydratase